MTWKTLGLTRFSLLRNRGKSRFFEIFSISKFSRSKSVQVLVRFGSKLETILAKIWSGFLVWSDFDQDFDQV